MKIWAFARLLNLAEFLRKFSENSREIWLNFCEKCENLAEIPRKFSENLRENLLKFLCEILHEICARRENLEKFPHKIHAKRVNLAKFQHKFSPKPEFYAIFAHKKGSK